MTTGRINPTLFVVSLTSDLFAGYRTWEVSHLFRREISRGMHSKSCLGARDMSTSVKRVFLRRSLWVRTILKKNIENCIGWCSQIAKRMDFGSCYEHIMIL